MFPLSVLSALLAFPFPAADPPASPAVRGTVWIRAGDKSVGTGWVVDVERKWVVTARHVLADRDTADVFFLDPPITHREHYITDRADLQKRGRTATGRLVRKNDRADLALLVLDRLPPDIPALLLDSRPAAVGAACFSVGHRHDADLLWTRTDGHVRQVGTLANGYFWAGQRIGADVPVLLAQSPIESGDSGSALLNSRGEVIGVVSALSSTPGVAIAIAASEVCKLLADAGKVERTPPRPPTKIDRPADALQKASVWVRPRATEGRAAGVLIDRNRKFILTSAAAVGFDDIVDVVVPRRADGRLVAELAAYQDLLGLRLSGDCIQGVVWMQDVGRDLALIELDRVPETLDAIPLGSAPNRGDRISAIAHPTGEELLWLYSAGSVRSVGWVTLRKDGTEEAAKPMVSLLQLPHQGSASGGPVVNEQGELIGILSAREGSRQEMAYAATPDEIRAFLKAARPQAQPETSAEWHARGRFLDHRGRPALALAAYQEASRLAPRDAVLRAFVARALADLGSVELARAAIKQGVAITPRPALADALLAQALLKLGEKAATKMHADAALKANPKLPDALVARAALQDRTEALADLKEALFLDPACVRAYRLRADLHDPADPDVRQKILADLTRTLELSPYNAAARVRRARLQIELKQPKKAVADLTRLTEWDPLNATHWLALANAQFRAGDRPAAAGAMASVVRIEPGRSKDVWRGVSRLAGILQEDNSADHQRLAEWYATALRATDEWLPAADQLRLRKALNATNEIGDDRGRAELLGRLVAEWGGAAK